MDTNTDSFLCCPVCLLEMENVSTELEVRRLCLGPTWMSASVFDCPPVLVSLSRGRRHLCVLVVLCAEQQTPGPHTVLEGCSREVKQRIVCTLYCGITKG